MYLDTVAIIERLHRRCLDVIGFEIEKAGVRDINSIQALILFNIGHEELTVGELTLRGCYHGSNVSYNLKKLREAGYVSHEQSAHDRRSFRVKLTPQGHEVRGLLQNMFDTQAEMMSGMEMTEGAFRDVNQTLFFLDRVWTNFSNDFFEDRVGMRLRAV